MRKALEYLVVFLFLLAVVLSTGCCKRQRILVEKPCEEKKYVRREWAVHEGGDCPPQYVCLTPADADAISDEIEGLRDALKR